MLTYAPTTDPNQLNSTAWCRSVGHDQEGPSKPECRGGGTSSLAYARNLAGDADAPSGAFQRTTETDRNGNVRVHYFDAARRTIKLIERTNRAIRPGEPDYVTTYIYTLEGQILQKTLPRGNQVEYLYDTANPLRKSQGNLLEERRKSNGIAGGGVDLVTRWTYEPVFNQVRTVTDSRAFPAGTVPLDGNGRLDLSNPQVARYMTTTFFDYQEGTGFQVAKGIPASERIPDGMWDLNVAADVHEGNVGKVGIRRSRRRAPTWGRGSRRSGPGTTGARSWRKSSRRGTSWPANTSLRTARRRTPRTGRGT